MESGKTVVTVGAIVNAPVEKVWESWTDPVHIVKWNSASDDWHTPWAKNDLRTGGAFSSRMEARDGSMGFEFGGVYDEVKINELISYTMADGRRVEVFFEPDRGQTKVTENFDAETQNPVEMQQAGWQSIMDSFKRYTESL